MTRTLLTQEKILFWHDKPEKHEEHSWSRWRSKWSMKPMLKIIFSFHLSLVTQDIHNYLSTLTITKTETSINIPIHFPILEYNYHSLTKIQNHGKKHYSSQNHKYSNQFPINLPILEYNYNSLSKIQNHGKTTIHHKTIFIKKQV